MDPLFHHHLIGKEQELPHEVHIQRNIKRNPGADKNSQQGSIRNHGCDQGGRIWAGLICKTLHNLHLLVPVDQLPSSSPSPNISIAFPIMPFFPNEFCSITLPTPLRLPSPNIETPSRLKERRKRAVMRMCDQ